MSFRAEAIIAPSLRSEIARQPVAIAAEIHRPAFAKGIQYKRAQIQMPVAGTVAASFKAHIDCVGLAPGTAKKGGGNPVKLGAGRPIHGGRGAAGRLVPQQFQDGKAGSRFPLLIEESLSAQGAFMLPILRMLKACAQPEHLRGPAAVLGCIGEIRGLAQRPDRLHAVITGPVKPAAGGQAEIGSQSGFEGGQITNVVGSGIIPINGPFLKSSIRRKQFHDFCHGCARGSDDRRRLAALLISNGQCAQRQPAEADLHPVVM